MIMFDSLNRRFLPNYGCTWVHAPNFERLSEHTVTFDNAYVGSMPCMPARRELHTGRYNFLHRSWGPMEPFDDSVPEILKLNGVYTHLVSDHQHYWEDGGSTYHTRYTSWEGFRGQEGDPWKADLNPEIRPNHMVPGEVPRTGNFLIDHMPVQDMINRAHMKTASQMPQARTFEAGLEFLETNYSYDQWFLQIETFDPHEPFFSAEEYQALYESPETIGTIDWPPYGPCTQSEETIRRIRNKYAALVSMCDHYLGTILDFMDAHDMWKDTALLVTTDHGYLLGEHEWWSKCIMPMYNEVAHIPMFAWDPRVKKCGERRSSLVQNIDIAASLLELFGMPLTSDMEGRPLRSVIENDTPIHECVLYGHHASHVNITDGRYVYMRSPASRENGPIYEYTLMPTHMRNRFTVNELKDLELAGPFSFTKGLRVLKTPAHSSSPVSGKGVSVTRFGTQLYDLQNDPEQKNPVRDLTEELRLIHAMQSLMHVNDAPAEQFIRIGLPCDREMTMEELEAEKAAADQQDAAVPVDGFKWTPEAKEQFTALTYMTGRTDLPELFLQFAEKLPDQHQQLLQPVCCDAMYLFAGDLFPANAKDAVHRMLLIVSRKF